MRSKRESGKLNEKCLHSVRCNMRLNNAIAKQVPSSAATIVNSIARKCNRKPSRTCRCSCSTRNWKRSQFLSLNMIWVSSLQNQHSKRSCIQSIQADDIATVTTSACWSVFIPPPSAFPNKYLLEIVLNQRLIEIYSKTKWERTVNATTRDVV
jgi:hypothetical protein